MWVKLLNNTWGKAITAKSECFIVDSNNNKTDMAYTEIRNNNERTTPYLEVQGLNIGDWYRVKVDILENPNYTYAHNYVGMIRQISKINNKTVYFKNVSTQIYQEDLEKVALTEGQKIILTATNIITEQYCNRLFYNIISNYITTNNLDIVKEGKTYLMSFKKGGKKFKVKPGRFITSIGFSDMAKQFSDLIKIMTIDIKPEIITKDICWSYDEVNYTPGGGSINGSCMRHVKCQDKISFYEKNGIELLRVIQDDKVLARAILWRLDDGNTYLDRVYARYEFIETKIRNLAQANGWLIKKYNDSDAHAIIKPNGEVYNDILKVTIPENNTGIDKVDAPYMDTLCYYDLRNSVLQNVEPSHNDWITLRHYF